MTLLLCASSVFSVSSVVNGPAARASRFTTESTEHRDDSAHFVSTMRPVSGGSLRMHAIKPITVAQYGIGPIGAEIARLLLTKPWVKIVAAVDIDPNKIGKDLGEVIGLGRSTGVIVTPELEGKPDVVCHSTGSRLRDVAGQLSSLLE